MDHTHEVGGSSPSAPTGQLYTKWHGVLSSDTDVTCGWGLFWRGVLYIARKRRLVLRFSLRLDIPAPNCRNFVALPAWDMLAPGS
jgi:hypothetical protein